MAIRSKCLVVLESRARLHELSELPGGISIEIELSHCSGDGDAVLHVQVVLLLSQSTV